MLEIPPTISPRLRNALKELGVTSLNQIAALDPVEVHRDLGWAGLRNAGQRSLSELAGVLNQFGLRLRLFTPKDLEEHDANGGSSHRMAQGNRFVIKAGGYEKEARPEPKPEAIKYLDARALEQRLCHNRSTIFRWYKAGRFPVPKYLMSKRVWLLTDIEDWERSNLTSTAPRGPK